MPTPPPAVNSSIKVTKSLAISGKTRFYANRYHFNGGVPAGTSAWTTLADAVVLAEKSIHASGSPTGPTVHITQVDGYNAGSEVAVFTKLYTTLGTLALGGVTACPEDCAAMVRFATAARSTKNHPIYAFNYYHGITSQGVGAEDTLTSAIRTAIDAYALAWITGFSDGTNTLVRATPAGHGCTSRVTSTLITHRDFPK